MMILRNTKHLLFMVRGSWNMVHDESSNISYTLWSTEKTIFTYLLNYWLEICPMN